MASQATEIRSRLRMILDAGIPARLATAAFKASLRGSLRCSSADASTPALEAMLLTVLAAKNSCLIEGLGASVLIRSSNRALQ